MRCFSKVTTFVPDYLHKEQGAILPALCMRCQHKPHSFPALSESSYRNVRRDIGISPLTTACLHLILDPLVEPHCQAFPCKAPHCLSPSLGPPAWFGPLPAPLSGSESTTETWQGGGQAAKVFRIAGPTFMRTRVVRDSPTTSIWANEATRAIWPTLCRVALPLPWRLSYCLSTPPRMRCDGAAASEKQSTSLLMHTT